VARALNVVLPRPSGNPIPVIIFPVPGRIVFSATPAVKPTGTSRTDHQERVIMLVKNPAAAAEPTILTSVGIVDMAIPKRIAAMIPNSSQWHQSQAMRSSYHRSRISGIWISAVIPRAVV
jgi:hypothetical protein